MTHKEIADAVFTAIELAQELGLRVADDVGEFAEDLYSEVNGEEI